MNKIFRKITRLLTKLKLLLNSAEDETALLAIGAMLSNQQWLLNSANINDYEFKIFSQSGDDGIIQYLIKFIHIENKIFIEFGVEDYLESNTRFLMMNNNWTGFVMDGSEEAMTSLKNRHWYWKYDLTNKAVFIDRENINGLLAATGFSNIGLLHIDIDGNDYHVISAIDLSKLNPSIIIMEYNSIFGNDRTITVPYDKHFNRTKAHYSNLFFGASLPAFQFVLSKRGYSLVGCNIAGSNAYFVRTDLLNEKVKEVPLDIAFKENVNRQGRNPDYSLSLLRGNERLEIIKGLEVINVLTNQPEKL